MSDLEQERRVSGGRAVREARLDGGDDAARHAVAVPVGLAAPGAPRVVAGGLEPREALVPLVGPALGAPVPRLRLVALRGGVCVGVGVAAVARRPAPERRERLRERARRRGPRPRDVDAAQVLGHGELALEGLGLDLGLRGPLADAAELAEEEGARRALLAVRRGFGRRRDAGVSRRGLGGLVRGIGRVRVADEGREPRGVVVGDVRGHAFVV